MVNRRSRPSGMSPADFERAQRQAQGRLDDRAKFYADRDRKDKEEKDRRRNEVSNQSDEQVELNERMAERRAAELKAAREQEKINKAKEKFLRDKQLADSRASGSPNEPIAGSGGFADF